MSRFDIFKKNWFIFKCQFTFQLDISCYLNLLMILAYYILNKALPATGLVYSGNILLVKAMQTLDDILICFFEYDFLGF